MKLLAPRAVWLFYVQSIIAFIILYFVIGIYFGFSIAAIIFEQSESIITYTIIINIILFILVLFIGFIWAKLSYKNYKYELREDGFRKECGVIMKKYVTVPYERIQNVDIYRGIVARLLGLSDLHIQTAGNSAVSGRFGMGAEGRLPGLTTQDAEAIRDELIRRSKGLQITQNQTLTQAQTNQPQPSNPQSQQGL